LAGKTQNIQTGFHDAVRSLFGDVAADAGVKPAPAQSLHDLAGNIAAAIETKAKGLYSQIDQAMGGTAFQTYNQQIDNVRRALRTSAGINPDADGRLIERINDLEDAKSKAWELAKQAGVNPDLGDAANALWRQKSALEDLGKQVQGSITGLRADLANGVQAAQETLSPAKLSTRANRLYNTGRLQQAIGERADDLLRATESTKQRLQDAVTSAAEQTKAAKGTAAQQSAVVSRNRALATSSAGAVGAGGVFELLRHLLGE
jgi:Skp family chaperone for outer membrane proteins